MSRQANLTLTALAQQGGSIPDIPIRHMKLNHRTREVILGRASLKEPKPNRDGSKNTNEVLRIAREDNGYMSRNETIASEHAALLLRQDGVSIHSHHLPDSTTNNSQEVCLEHRAGSFPPTFLNGNRVNEIVTVQNNDIINLGPLSPYYSRSKQRLYQPFALMMNLTFEHVLLSDDDNSSSSSDDEVTSVHEAPSHYEHPDRLQMIRGHEIIEVSDEESEESDEEDALYTRTSQTVIIDLTESEVEQRADAVDKQAEVFPHFAFAEYDDSSSGEELDEEIDENEIADLEDDMESIDNDSIFGDNDSNAPSEHPIEREPVGPSFAPNSHLNYGPDPDLFRDDLNFDINVIEDASEEDEDDVDHEPGMGPHQDPFVSQELSNFQEAEEQRIREQERILEKGKKARDAMTEEQQQQEAKLRAALVETKKIKDMIMQQQQKQRPAELLESFEAEQRIVRETNQNMADRKAREVEEIELARQQGLIKELNKKRFEELVAKANTPPQESMVASQMRNQNTTGFHQQGRDTHEAYVPPFAESNSAAHQDFYPDKAFRVNALDGHDLNPLSNSCQPIANPAAELSSCHSPYEPPHHSFDEFAAARDDNTRKMARGMVLGQHPPPPTLLMSSSLFGQPMETGMTLPPPNSKQKENMYARFRVAKLANSQEAAQKYFTDHHSSWRAIQNGKVSIDDLVDHEEEEEDSSDKGLLDRAVDTVLAKDMRGDSPAPEFQMDQKNDPRYFMFKHREYPIPVPNMPEFQHWKENQKETTKELSSSPPVDNPPNRTDKAGDDKSEPSAPSMPTKKRKHVEFDEHDTIISPIPGEAQDSYTSMPTDFDGVPINSAHCNIRELIMASINSKLDADTNASAAGIPAEKQIHFASSPVAREQDEQQKKVEEQVIERPIATPHRPSKRVKMMKNAVEKAAYVLAGAAVASVGVFAALVSTAPEDF